MGTPISSSAVKSVSRATVFFYSLPMLAGGVMSMLTGSYFMKYATDVLLIAPGAIGTLFFISRIWDAINDPIAGYLADRTKSKFGARKIWIAISALPIALSFFLLWNPPFDEGFGVTLWAGFFLLLFYTFFTALYVPHYSLGADLTADVAGVTENQRVAENGNEPGKDVKTQNHRANDRNRIYGGRAIAENIGNFAGVAAMQAFIALSAPREHAPGIIAIVSLLSLAAIGLMLVYIKEETDQKTPQNGFFHSLLSVFTNSKARLVLIAGFFGQMGATVVFTLALFHAEYVMNDPQAGPLVIAIFMGVATVCIPLWVRYLKNRKKQKVWVMVNICLGAVFAASYVLQQGDSAYLLLAAAMAGAAGSAVLIVHPSLLADTIQYGASENDSENKATYFSMFTFMNKNAMGFAGVTVGFLLQVFHFIPNVEQSAETLTAIRAAFAFLPAICFFTGAIVIYNYRENDGTF